MWASTGTLLGLTMSAIQLRGRHWVIADMVGKAGHIRTVPIPLWVKTAVNAWTEAAKITSGRLFRSINKAGRIWGDGMTPKVLWEVVKNAVASSGIEKRLHRTISDGPVPGYVISQAVSWTRPSSFSDTFRFKRLSGTLAANRNCASL
jgi:hypothetical protein